MNDKLYHMKSIALALGAGALFVSPVFAQPAPQARPPHAQLFQDADKDNDGALTLEEITAVRPKFPKEAFTRMDKNSDGKITAEEFGKGHDGQGAPGGPGGLMRGIMKNADTNGDHKVTREEFNAAAPKDAPADAFDRMDKNGDGVLSREDHPKDGPEGPQGHGGPPPGGPHMSPREMFDEVDTNDDGIVTLKEHKAHAAKRAVEHFNVLDKNGDGQLTKDEIPEHGPGGPHGGPRGKRPDGPPPAP